MEGRVLGLYPSGFGRSPVDSWMFGGGFSILLLAISALPRRFRLHGRPRCRPAAQEQQLPRLTADASVVSRRTEIPHHRRSGADHVRHAASSARYDAAFEAAGGGRMELAAGSPEYGLWPRATRAV